MSESLPSRAVCISGALSVAIGVGAIVHMLAGILDGGFVFDLGIVGIPIGYEILLGRRSARAWALLFSAVGIAVVIAAGAIMTYMIIAAGEAPDIPELVFGGMAGSVFLAGCVYVQIALRAASAREWFQAPKRDTAAAGRIAWSVTAVAVVFLVLLYAADLRRTATVEALYSFDTVVIPCDAETGDRLPSIGCPGMTRHRGELPKVEWTARVASDMKSEARVRGIATRPVKLTISSEGYEDAVVTVTPDSKKEMRIAMTRAAPPPPERRIETPSPAPRGK
ncbi:MAG TPA: hypothetical protein DCM87_10535 [Planctomycetes bacterium]|nr:hypothetical protein [Planctomycetota bacterium]